MFGLHRSYTATNTNLEGFNGKMLTKFHCDVMYTSLKICKEMGLITK